MIYLPLHAHSSRTLFWLLSKRVAEKRNQVLYGMLCIDLHSHSFCLCVTPFSGLSACIHSLRATELLQSCSKSSINSAGSSQSLWGITFLSFKPETSRPLQIPPTKTELYKDLTNHPYYTLIHSKKAIAIFSMMTIFRPHILNTCRSQHICGGSLVFVFPLKETMAL